MVDKINSPKKENEMSSAAYMANVDLVRVCETLEYSHTINEDRGKDQYELNGIAKTCSHISIRRRPKNFKKCPNMQGLMHG